MYPSKVIVVIFPVLVWSRRWSERRIGRASRVILEFFCPWLFLVGLVDGGNALRVWMSRVSDARSKIEKSDGNDDIPVRLGEEVPFRWSAGTISDHEQMVGCA